MKEEIKGKVCTVQASHMRMRKEMSAYRRESHFAHGKSRC
jgi:hypothetical protein